MCIRDSDVTVAFGGSNGHFELNVFKPVIAYNNIQSIQLLSDAINSFVKNCLVDIKPNESKIKELMESSLMLVTALNPHIGYDNAAKIAKKAHQENKTLLQAGLELEILTEEQFHDWIKPEEMTNP